MKIIVKMIITLSLVTAIILLMYIGCFITFTLAGLTAFFFSNIGLEKVAMLISGGVYCLLFGMVTSIPTLKIKLITDKLEDKAVIIYIITVIVSSVILYISLLDTVNYI